jgi:hypothetical protein
MAYYQAYDYQIDYKVINHRQWEDALSTWSKGNLHLLFLDMHHMIEHLKNEAEAQGLESPIEWANHHPIMRLMAHQVSMMVGNNDVSEESDEMQENLDKWTRLAEHYIELEKENVK